jgi:hypothetical protein
MKPLRAGQLVTVTDDDATLDGIVAQTPSMLKLVVAVPDPKREAVLREFHRSALRERRQAGEHDTALRRVIGKASAAGGHGGPRSAQGRRGHTRAPAHRTPGR